MALDDNKTFLEQFHAADISTIQANPNSVVELRRLLDINGALLLKNMLLDQDHFEFIAQAISQNSKVSEAILEAKVSHAADAALFNVADLPLHSDGVIIQKSTDAIVFYAQHVANQPSGAGDLILSNHAQAFSLMPESMKNILDKQGLEYLVLDRRPFPFLPEGWFTVPTLRMINHHLYLYLALPFGATESAFWQVRVKGMSAVDSENFLKELHAYLMQDEFFIRHAWQSGDLVLLDNRQVFHGFHATNSASQIYLHRKNIQLV